MIKYITCFCYVACCFMFTQVMATKITIYADKHLEADSMTVQVYNQILNGEHVEFFNKPYMVCTVAENRGAFRFSLPVEKMSYINVVVNRQQKEIAGDLSMLLRLYVVEPDDDISLRLIKSRNDTTHLAFGLDNEISNHKHYRNYDFEFTGRGAAKYACRYAMDGRLMDAPKLARLPFTREGKFIKPNLYGDMEMQALSVLHTYQPKISPGVFELLELDIKSNWRNKLVLATIRMLSAMKDREERMALANQVEMALESNGGVSDQSFLSILSKYETIYRVNRLRMKYCAIRGNDYTYNEDAFYYLLKQTNDRLLQEKAITTLLCFYLKRINHGDQVLKDALEITEHPYYKSVLQKMANSSLTAKPAFDFILPNQKGELVHLSDYRGKVVFVDFWFTGCGACRYFYSHVLSNVEQRFRNEPDVVFISISVDRQKALWQKSINEGIYTSNDVVNLYTQGKGNRHEVIQHYQVTSYPKPMIIDKEGNVFTYNNASLREVEGLSTQLIKALKQ